MMKRPLFRELMSAFADKGVRFVRMDDLAREILAQRELTLELLNQSGSLAES